VSHFFNFAKKYTPTAPICTKHANNPRPDTGDTTEVRDRSQSGGFMVAVKTSMNLAVTKKNPMKEHR
jgi:hypothetical protein